MPSTDLSTLYLRFFNTKLYTTSLSHHIELLLYKYKKYFWAYGKIVYLGNRYIGKMQKVNASLRSWTDLHMYYYSNIHYVNVRYIINKYWISLIISFLIAFVSTYVCVDQLDSWWVFIRRRFCLLFIFNQTNSHRLIFPANKLLTCFWCP